MKKKNTMPAATVAPQKDFSLIDEALLKSRIYMIRGVKVMLDADLAEIYGYSTKVFNRQVKSNNPSACRVKCRQIDPGYPRQAGPARP